jgi:cytoskeletal protein CcmA (bactofilin family)
MDKKNRGEKDSPERLNRLVSGVKLNGDLTTESSLRLEGQVIGNIKCTGKFVLGSTGKLIGDLIADESEIEGVIEGDVTISGLLTLKKTAIIKGSITTKRIVIEDGAQIGGNIAAGEAVKSIKNTNFKQVAAV